jgi:hypothetical protein
VWKCVGKWNVPSASRSTIADANAYINVATSTIDSHIRGQLMIRSANYYLGAAQLFLRPEWSKVNVEEADASVESGSLSVSTSNTGEDFFGLLGPQEKVKGQIAVWVNYRTRQMIYVVIHAHKQADIKDAFIGYETLGDYHKDDADLNSADLSALDFADRLIDFKDFKSGNGIVLASSGAAGGANLALDYVFYGKSTIDNSTAGQNVYKAITSDQSYLSVRTNDDSVLRGHILELVEVGYTPDVISFVSSLFSSADRTTSALFALPVALLAAFYVLIRQ